MLRTTTGGSMSSKLFSIFVDELINEIEAINLGITIGKLKISAIMYADELLLISTTKRGISQQLKVIEKYGNNNGIKFNPDKTELMVFNEKVKRTRRSITRDDWNGELKLDDKIIKQSKSIKYLGTILSQDLKNKTHIKKRRAAAYAALSRVNNIGLCSHNIGI